MICLFNTLMKGTMIRKNVEGERIAFYSFNNRGIVEGIVLGEYSKDYGAKIVQYECEGKKELAIVEKKITHKIAPVPVVADVATNERLVYISELKNGMAVACRKAIYHLNVIILNERGECVQNIGRRRVLMNKKTRGQTNRKWIQHEKSFQFMR